VLRGIAEERGSPIAFVDEELEELSSRFTPEGTELGLRFRGEAPRRYRLALIGDFQAENAALVDLAARRTLGLAGEALERGLQAARLPARLELLRAHPAVVLDGAHTPHSVERILAVFGPFSDRRRHCSARPRKDRGDGRAAAPPSGAS
jgi:dihydrofolate synthase/folylpolyglutamate synthase